MRKPKYLSKASVGGMDSWWHIRLRAASEVDAEKMFWDLLKLIDGLPMPHATEMAIVEAPGCLVCDGNAVGADYDHYYLYLKSPPSQRESFQSNLYPLRRNLGISGSEYCLSWRTSAMTSLRISARCCDKENLVEWDGPAVPITEPFSKKGRGINPRKRPLKATSPNADRYGPGRGVKNSNPKWPDAATSTYRFRYKYTIITTVLQPGLMSPEEALRFHNKAESRSVQENEILQLSLRELVDQAANIPR
ncbi:plant Tudor-like RNA-binding protein [Striga asiatica]|uniref:Plant Tudor-like RNA-binding protein n=1 Tax=Striga asiatica TaxID=4170 RepID=A0A5A7NYZ8_STRAF|nr:plant Tudor-like RNA-binding protein [Striga asiatica]